MLLEPPRVWLNRLAFGETISVLRPSSLPGGAGMQNEFLSSRRRELESRARNRGLDVDARLEGLDASDDGLIVAVLASLLGLPIKDAFDGSAQLDELERTANELARSQQLLEKQAEHWQELRGRLGEEGTL
jgi:hypothetical protein